MKGLSRGNSIFRKKTAERDEEPEKDSKKNITLNLTINLSLDKDSLSKAMDMLDLYSEYADDSSSYKKSNSSNEYRYKF
jgi:hypothetical protein